MSNAAHPRVLHAIEALGGRPPATSPARGRAFATVVGVRRLPLAIEVLARTRWPKNASFRSKTEDYPRGLEFGVSRIEESYGAYGDAPYVCIAGDDAQFLYFAAIESKTPADPPVYCVDHEGERRKDTPIKLSELLEDLEPERPVPGAAAAKITDRALAEALQPGRRKAIDPKKLASLKAVFAGSCGVASLAGLEACAKLQKARLSYNAIRDFGPLASLRELRELNLDANPATDLAPLARLTKLVTLKVGSMHDPLDLTPLGGLTALVDLAIRATRLDGLSRLGACAKLRRLAVRQGGVIDERGSIDLRAFAPFAQLRELDVRAKSIKSLDALAELPRLRVLVLRGVSDVTSLRAPGVVELDLCANQRLRNIAALAKLPALRKLDLRATGVQKSDKTLSQLAKRGVRVVGP
jgi:hypothetical protein